jgi:hypothetical protein
MAGERDLLESIPRFRKHLSVQRGDLRCVFASDVAPAELAVPCQVTADVTMTPAATALTTALAFEA